MAKKSYTVGQVNGYIKNLISSDYLLGDIYVKGEVSNCKYHSSGHIYFSLKDETGSIMAVMFKSYAYSGLDFKLENGQQVVCHGSVNIYERDGRYQLYVKEIKLDGIGNLYERYEQLKQKLYEQGLFEFDIKKPIPAYPKRVGIVTAQTGAAIQDIRNIAKRRNPYVQLILYPAKVQGEYLCIIYRFCTRWINGWSVRRNQSDPFFLGHERSNAFCICNLLQCGNDTIKLKMHERVRCQ